LLAAEVKMLEREGRAGLDVTAALEAKACGRLELEAQKAELTERCRRTGLVKEVAEASEGAG
jgi:hypothetical protein